ncbi:MAG: hypothetical protein ACK5WG_06295 [Betaproteobacteria bacterium]
MRVTSLHQNLIAAAGARGAMLISGGAINSAVLDSLRKAAFGLVGASVDTLHPKVTARFDEISVEKSQLRTELVSEAGNVVVRVTPDFNLTLSLVHTQDPTQRYAKLLLAVSDIRLMVRTDGSDIRFQLVDPTVAASFSDDPAGSRAAAIAASGIDPDELLRVEGSFAYGTGARLVASAIGKLPPIGLRDLFPAIDFSNSIELAIVGDSLAIIPDSMSLLEMTGCPQGNAAGGIVVTPQHPTKPTEDTRDWVIAARHNPSEVRKPSPRDPFTALHLPRSLLDVRFGKIAPAVSYRERDNGFIGYDIQLTGTVKEIQVSIDESLGAVRLKLGFAVWGSLVADVDLPSIGRVDLASARIELPENNGQSNIEALVRLAVDSGAQLLATTEIAHIDLGKARVVLDLFGKYLSAAGGKAAVAGFILDSVIGRVIAHNIPPIVSQVVRESLDRNFFVLTRLKGLSQYIDALPNLPTFSGNSDFALLGSYHDS